MENKELLALILSVGGGTFCVVASIFNWDFFFGNRRAVIFMKIFGRTGTRILYTLIGFLLYFSAYKIFAG